jgi:SAM-dependent methyltransferase
MPNPFASPAMAAGYAKSRPAVHPHIIERVRAFLGATAPLHRGLDVGCGAGLSTRALQGLAAQCVGLDPAPEMGRCDGTAGKRWMPESSWGVPTRNGIRSQNPVEHHGTYPLPESQLDRFLVRARMTYPEADSEREILRAEAGAARLDEVRPVLGAEELIALQEEAARVRVDESLVNYALEIVRRTRSSEYLSLGVSPRGSLMLYRAAQAMAFAEGRSFTTPADFKSLAIPVLGHRVVVNGRYSSTKKRSEQAEEILREIMESVAVPI